MGKPIYTLNESYFNSIKSHSQAYILGFIYADGSIDAKSGKLTFVISKKDIEILNFIKKELNYSGPIAEKIINERLYSVLSIVRKNFVKDLINLGIIPNKTYDSVSFPIIPNEFFNSFLLGFFDGDGHINTACGDTYLCFSNNKIILEQLQKFFINQFNIKGYLRLRNKNSNNTGMLEIKGSLQISTILEFLYKESPFHLKRKKNIFDDVFQKAQEFKSKSWKFNGNEKKVLDLYNNGMRQFEIAKHLNLSGPHVRSCIQRNRKKGLCI